MNSAEDLKSMYVKLVENLNCCICQSTLNDARDLSCGHTFCLACLQELVAMKGWTKTIQCCLCKKETAIPSSGLGGLKQNYKLNCILDEQRDAMEKLVAMMAASARSSHISQEPELQIFVRDLEGKSQTITVRLSDTAESLKKKVEKKTGIPPNTQRLIYGGKQLTGIQKLCEYGVHAQSTIELSIPLKGGRKNIAKPCVFRY